MKYKPASERIEDAVAACENPCAAKAEAEKERTEACVNALAGLNPEAIGDVVAALEQHVTEGFGSLEELEAALGTHSERGTRWGMTVKALRNLRKQ